MLLFGPKYKYVTLDQAEIDKNELFVRKQIDRPNKHVIIVVPELYNAILIKQGEYCNSLPSGKYPAVNRNEKKISVELMYVSKTREVEIKWGLPGKFELSDKNCNVAKVGARGSLKFKIAEPRKAYFELIDSENSFSEEHLQTKLRNRLCVEIQPFIAKAVNELNLEVDSLDKNCIEVAALIMPMVAEMIKRDYGLQLDMFTVDAISVEI